MIRDFDELNDELLSSRSARAFDTLLEAAGLVWREGRLANADGSEPAAGVLGTTRTYDNFGYMPNSCSKCHPGARRASELVAQ